MLNERYLPRGDRGRVASMVSRARGSRTTEVAEVSLNRAEALSAYTFYTPYLPDHRLKLTLRVPLGGIAVSSARGTYR